MKRCPNCKAEILFDDTEFCELCGKSVKEAAKSDNDDNLEFTVTESHDSKDDDPSIYTLKPKKDTLGVQSSAEWLQGQAENEPDHADSPSPAVTPSQHDEPEMTESQKIRRLSQQEVQSIEQKLYSKGSYLSENEKQALLKKMAADVAARTSEPAPLKPGDLPKPSMSKRGRGLAYFMKNYIQIQGDIDLHENDEIVIGERPYVLRKKRLHPKTVATAASVAFILVLAVLVPMLVRDTHNGQGEIVGVALDENNQPFISGAVIRLPESGKTVTANAQGFFRTGHLNPGTHRIEYVVNGQTMKVDYATVSAGDLTTMTLSPGRQEVMAATSPTVPESADGYAQEYDDSRLQADPQQEKQSRVSQASTTEQTGYGKLTLAANVEGAKLTVDGAVLGAGNMTFSRIKAGARRYTISKDGYQAFSGVVNILPNENSTLEIALNPTPETQATLSLQGQYDQAMAYLRSGNTDQAVAGLTEIIDQQPGYTPAYLGRAEAYASVAKKTAAHDDYLRAAEILRINGDHGQAMTAFNNAVKMDPKSVPALLGRASLHMARHEEIAAIADYEAILNIDKRSSQALFGLGEARFSQGNYKQAIKHFKDARSEDPGNPMIYQYLMLCYFGDDDHKNVKKTYDKFKEMATQDQLQRLRGDKTYSAVLRVVENEQ